MSNVLKALQGVGAEEPLYSDSVFSSFVYTGNGSTQTINNGIDLAGKGGMVWFKARNQGAAGWDHVLMDTARGLRNCVFSNTTNPNSLLPADTVTAWNSNGFSLGADASTYLFNGPGGGYNYVAWTFRNAPKFFDVVTYTGTGAVQNIAHSLGLAPGMIIIKSTSNALNWAVYHKELGNGAAYLNTTSAAFAADPIYWNNTAHTATQFTLGTWSASNTSGATYVAYLFAHDPSADGIIQCGSYVGNGATPSITLGWEPQYVMIKRADSTGNWVMLDVMRGMPASASSAKGLRANLSDAEVTAGATASGFVVPTATGFYVTGDNNIDWLNASGGTYIYLAIRRPNKPPTLGTQVYNAIARTGTGAAATVTGVGFAPDLVYSKSRNTGGAHGFHDRLRGSTAEILTNSTASEFVDASSITAMGADGITVGADGSGSATINYSGWNYIAHFFKRAVGVMDVVCDTGTGAAHTISHNLAAIPELIIRKGRSGATQWEVWHSGIANTEKLILNATDAKATDTAAWNSTSPTASVFTVGTGANVNTSTATYVTYLFATLAGISKCGTYTGNGTTQNIEMGFSAGARFFLVKAISATGSWVIFDSVRGIIAGSDPYLLLNSTAAEDTDEDAVDPYAGGITVNETTASNINTNSTVYCYLAIA